jgi:hypothetical protein
MNDNVFGQAQIGPEFGLDPATFERVRSFAGRPRRSMATARSSRSSTSSPSGARRSAAIRSRWRPGTLGTVLTRVMSGQRFANGVDMILSATYAKSAGNPRLFYPAFDTAGLEQRDRGRARR